MNNYYKQNLNKLGKLKRDDSIKISFNGKQTNYFALNDDSIKALKEFIDNIEL